MNRNALLNAMELANVPRSARRRMRFCDAAVTDAATILRMVMDGATLDRETRERFQDDALSYYRHELDRLDPALIDPLHQVTWADDMDTLTVSMGEASTSFIKQKFAAVGSQSATGLPWLNTNSNTLPGVSIDGERLIKPLRELGMEITLTEYEMARAQLLGRPIDTQKFEALNVIYQLGIDQMVYRGDTAVGATGLVNQPNTMIATTNFTNGAWSGNTPAETLAGLNIAFQQAIENTSRVVAPTDMLIPWTQWGYLYSTQMTNINETIGSFFERTCLSSIRNGQKIKIRPCKWLTGAGAGETDRMVLYSRKKEFVRFPMMPIKRLNTYHLGIAFHAPYTWVFGEVEMPRPETITYFDGI